MAVEQDRQVATTSGIQSSVKRNENMGDMTDEELVSLPRVKNLFNQF